MGSEMCIRDSSTTITNSLALKAPLAAPAFTGNATFDSTTLAIDATNNRVGIGTTSPQSLLHLQGSGNTGGLYFANSHNIVRQYFNNDSSGSAFFITYDGTGGAEIELQADGDLILNGSNGDNVGIGTTSPNSKLHIEGSDHTQLQIKSTDGTKVPYLALNNTDMNWHVRCDGGNGDKFIIRDNTNSANRLAIDTAGKVGIGTISPTTTLDVEGTVSYKHTAFSTAGPTDGIDVSDTTVLEVDTSSNNVVIGGFSGGVQGQILYIVKTNTANFIQLEHDETPAAGSQQKIYLTSGSDERVVGYGGYTLYCNGTAWYSLSNPTGAADAG